MNAIRQTEESKTVPVVSRDFADADTPGVQIQTDAAEAERLGATEETALSLDDAWDANADIADAATNAAAEDRHDG